MWAPSRVLSGSGRLTGHRRIADYLADDQTDASDNESFTTAHGDEFFAAASTTMSGVGGGMLPAFLADQSDLVEVMLELDEESMVLRSVTPTLYAPTALTPDGARSLSRSSSTASRIRRKFAWLRSPSPSTSRRHHHPPPTAAEPPLQAALAARERRRAQARLDRSRSSARLALKGLRFISRTTATGHRTPSELWRGVEERFNKLSRDGLLARDDFGACIEQGMEKSKEFAVCVFDALARRRRQSLERVTREELYDFWLQISEHSFDARLQIFFDMVDTNVDGRITREEVQELIVLSASANNLSKLEEQAEEYAALIMEELDRENLGYIELWQLEALLLQRDEYMAYSRQLSSGSATQRSQTLSNVSGPSQQKRRRRWSPRHAAARARVAASEGWQRAWVLALWFAAMAALFAWKFAEYRWRSPAFAVTGYCLPTAKGAAETLKLNMALVLLPVCRNTLTWLRSSWARYFVPFDDSIAFHKTWMYISVPLVLYIGERTLRAFRSKAYAVKILKVCLLPGNVLTITMSKPYGFRYRSGQYIFLQCPTISPFEWHPFSITSAPGDDCVSVHIQTRGDWRQELKRIFVENYFTPCMPRRTAFGLLGIAEQKSPPRLLVDGPYGAPAQDFRNYDVLLLIGLGIGATPFISIVRDLLNNIKLEDELMDLAMETNRSEDSTNSFSMSTTSSNKRRAYRTSHAHFYWITREPESFEWFKGVMNEVAEMDKKGVIELHNSLTSVYEERDARSTLLSMVQALNHAKHGVDIVSGTRVRTHFAKPNWKEVFTRIASNHLNSTVGVFYCGRTDLAKELKKLSIDMSHKTGTRFHFHKEYF